MPAQDPTPALLTIVGAHAKIRGTIEVADSVHVDCEVEGELRVGGALIIGERGVVTASVHTATAVIRGVYEGTMIASIEVEIASTGRATGTIETASLVVARGGVHDGTLVKRS